MNLNALIPNFKDLGTIDWSKPNVDTKSIFSLAALAGAVLMLIFCFCPWFGLTDDANTFTRLGITLWYGIFGFIFALVTVAGTLYRQHALAFCASVLCLLMGILGMVCWASLKQDGVEVEADLLKDMVELGKAFGAKISVVRWGAILYFISALVAACGTFCSATGVQLKK